jgi:5-methylcytosine-specific restriction protein A
MNRPWKAWYSTARWRKRREAQLSVEPLCRMCLGSEIVTAANTADHVVPHRGDPHLFWYGELQSLCASHHSRDKQLEEHGKTIVRFGPDGWPSNGREGRVNSLEWVVGSNRRLPITHISTHQTMEGSFWRHHVNRCTWRI